MYKPKPMTDMDLDKYIADLNEQYGKDFLTVYKRPIRPLHLLEAIAGASLLIGALSFLLWFLYPIYQKIVGGIR